MKNFKKYAGIVMVYAFTSLTPVLVKAQAQPLITKEDITLDDITKRETSDYYKDKDGNKVNNYKTNTDYELVSGVYKNTNHILNNTKSNIISKEITTKFQDDSAIIDIISDDDEYEYETIASVEKNEETKESKIVIDKVDDNGEKYIMKVFSLDDEFIFSKVITKDKIEVMTPSGYCTNGTSCWSYSEQLKHSGKKIEKTKIKQDIIYDDYLSDELATDIINNWNDDENTMLLYQLTLSNNNQKSKIM